MSQDEGSYINMVYFTCTSRYIKITLSMYNMVSQSNYTQELTWSTSSCTLRFLNIFSLKIESQM